LWVAFSIPPGSLSLSLVKYLPVLLSIPLKIPLFMFSFILLYYYVLIHQTPGDTVFRPD
jgi:hypothetical protein